jgi:predicted small secreted protein
LDRSIRNSDKQYKERIKRKLVGFAVYELFSFILLWDIAARFVSGESRRCIFILDNLDVLIHYEHLGSLFTGYYTFMHNCKNMISKIFGNHNLLQDYFFVFVMRETTQATVIEHLHDKNPRAQGYIKYDFSTVVPKESILEKRLDYLGDNHKSDNIKKISINLNKLCNDRFIKEYFFHLFNDDYRTSIESLCEFIKDKDNRDIFNDKFINDYFEIKNSPPYNTTVGSHGLFIRLLCDLFLEKKYIEMVLSTEIYESDFYGKESKHDSPSVNISRLILTYLKNQKKAVSIHEIIKTFNGICRQDDIFEAIWFLFELRNVDYWNHLVTFGKMIGLDNFQGQLDTERLTKTLHKDSTILLTPAGDFFLGTILVHFEYFSCRANTDTHNSYSLFDKRNMERVENNPENDFNFNIVIRDTFDLVKDCCARITKYYKAVFQGKYHFTDEKFLESDFAYPVIDQENNNNRMFHTDRIVHSHIDYLDVYRRYVINLLKNNEEKKEVNKKIVQYIKDYMNIFGSYNKKPITHFSKQSEALCELYKNCIKKIEESDYTNFELAIDRKTGHELEQ